VNNFPRKLNIGSGKSFREDYLNVDVLAAPGPDFVHDMSKAFPLGQSFTTARFGEIQIAPASFMDILADNVLEHIPDVVSAMKNCLDLLAIDGVLEVIVPYDLSFGAWQDPTHVRAFNERSWLYYTDWCWYLDWVDFRFDLVSQLFVLNPYGWELMPKHNDNVELVARYPRAVDALHVKLKKRVVTPIERESFRQYRR
jgi:SAM-dependent methyltransferase